MAAAAIATAALSATVAFAQQAPAPTAYPDADGWTFDVGSDPDAPEGWQPGAVTCLLLDLLEEPTGLLCGASNAFKPTDPDEADPDVDGNPFGSIWTEMTTLANAVGIFRSSGVWWSPKFTIADDPALANETEIATAQLAYDRLFFLDQLLGESTTQGRTEVTLFEEGATPDVMDDPDTNPDEEVDSKADDVVVPVTQEDLTFEDTADWATKKVDLGRTTLEPGKTYHLEFKSFLTTTESTQLIEGVVGIGYDNIKLSTTEPIPGPQGVAGQPGPQGIQGAQGPVGETPEVQGETQTGRPLVNSPEARRLLGVSTLVGFRGIGKFRDQVRQRLICRSATLERCEGTVRIRTANRVRLPRGRHRERITIGQAPYVLPPGRVGYAKVFATPIGRRLILGRAPLRVEVTVTVLDEDGVQQTLRERRTLRVAVR